MSVRIDDLAGAPELAEDSLDNVIGGRGREIGTEFCVWYASSLSGGGSDPLDVKVQM